ncbi:hypothetical protein T484DRAFT_2632041, partial [Baffinella frigidus]
PSFTIFIICTVCSSRLCRARRPRHRHAVEPRASSVARREGLVGELLQLVTGGDVHERKRGDVPRRRMPRRRRTALRQRRHRPHRLDCLELTNCRDVGVLVKMKRELREVRRVEIHRGIGSARGRRGLLCVPLAAVRRQGRGRAALHVEFWFLRPLFSSPNTGKYDQALPVAPRFEMLHE